METRQAIWQRRSCRMYDPRPLTKQQLQAICQAGRRAPNAYGWQQFRFIVIRDPQVLKDLDAISFRLLKEEYMAHDFFGCPQIVLVTGRRDNGCAYMDAACAMENMMLLAADMGLGSCWNNQFFTITDQPVLIRYLARLGITKKEEVCACLIVGRPAKGAKPEAKKLLAPVSFIG